MRGQGPSPSSGKTLFFNLHYAPVCRGSALGNGGEQILQNQRFTSTKQARGFSSGTTASINTCAHWRRTKDFCMRSPPQGDTHKARPFNAKRSSIQQQTGAHSVFLFWKRTLDQGRRELRGGQGDPLLRPVGQWCTL